MCGTSVETPANSYDTDAGIHTDVRGRSIIKGGNNDIDLGLSVHCVLTEK